MSDASNAMTDDATSSGAQVRAGVAQLESEERLDAVVAAIDPLATKASEGALGRALRGEWLGHALHPALTDLPIGCWVAAGLLDVVGGRRSRPAATRLLGLGLLAVPPTVASGLAEFGTTDGRAVRRVAAGPRRRQHRRDGDVPAVVAGPTAGSSPARHGVESRGWRAGVGSQLSRRPLGVRTGRRIW